MCLLLPAIMRPLTWLLTLGAFSNVPARASDDSSPTDSLWGARSPPFYPSPWMDGSGGWEQAHAKAQAFVKQLTLLEKVNLTTGVGWKGESCVGNTGSIPRLGFQGICFQDGPLGIRFADYVSAFPAGGTVAASFDRELWYERGYKVASEHRAKGVDVQLGPAIGPLGRTAAGGRNWEGFSPDPYLSGIAVAQTIHGMQDAGVIATVKHFIGNEQENFRQAPEAQGYGFNISESLSSNIDDTTLHELYLWPFADAVRAGAGAIMCSYTQINNSYGCQNSYMLNGVLKSELGFQGFVVSDWAGQESGMSSALAGLDVTMPGDTELGSGFSFWGSNLTLGVLNGTIPEWRIDDMVTRLMAAFYYVGRDKLQIPINFNSWSKDTYGYTNAIADRNWGLINQHVDVRENHTAFIREAAAKSTVLLKNSGVLPLSGHEKFTAVFGSDAGDSPYGPNGCDDRGCDNGTLAMGWGSGTSDFPFLVSPLTAIQNEIVQKNGGLVQSVTDDYAYAQVAALAAQATHALVFVNADAGEGYIAVDGNYGDRNNLTLWHAGDALIAAVAAQCNNTVVIIHSPGAVDMSTFADHPNVTAILWAGLPGEQSGNAIADVLYGRVNPGAKLPFTIARNTSSDYGTSVLYTPNNGAGAPQQDFTEGVLIDHRHFDAHNITPRFEFGFGLSYTTFAYSNLRITKHAAPPYTPRNGTSAPAPVLGNFSADRSAYLFPAAGIARVPLYIYPYLNTTAAPPPPPANFTFPPATRDGAPQPLLPASGAPGGHPRLWDKLFTVAATVTNTGAVPGDEVPQLYVALGGRRDAPRVLRGFERLRGVAPGESREVRFVVTRRDVSSWDAVKQDWVVRGEAKRVWVGASSRMLLLEGVLEV